MVDSLSHLSFGYLGVVNNRNISNSSDEAESMEDGEIVDAEDQGFVPLTEGWCFQNRFQY